jgi:hypothetical protein
MVSFFRRVKASPKRRRPSAVLRLERCEERAVPSASAAPGYIIQGIGPGQRGGGDLLPLGSLLPPASAKTPAQIRGAYGVSNILFGGVAGDGTGQTIAIIDAFNNPSFVSSNDPNFLTSDLHRFDAQFGLADPPIFIKSNQSGSTTSFPSNDVGWGTEIALDVEWAHAMAPGACILLIEATSNSTANLFAGVNFARSVTGSTFASFPNLPPVTCVSMSFGSNEFSGETSSDSTFTTPAGHAGVTFFASTGDNGAPGGYPAFSPNVVAVGGTSLTVSGNTWAGETGWSGSGGGISTQENKPTYQSLVSQSATRRTIPDVAMDGNPNTGVAVLDSFSQGSAAPWIQVGGTSLSSPLWAGFMAIANQGRVSIGEATLDGRTATLPKIYAETSAAGVGAADFHDVTSGNNGFAAGAGYDLVTGVGTPIGAGTIANLMDDAPPTGAATVTDVTSPGSQPYVFTVVFADNHNVKVSTLDSGDVMVQGPTGTIPVTFVSVNLNTNGSPRTATYQFTPPGGSWDPTDVGAYSVILQGGQVGDTAGNFAANATIGTFNVSFAPTVVSTQINDGSAQRSLVTSLTVTFSTQVSFAGNDATSAFSLVRNDNANVSFTASASVVNGQTVVILNGFTGAATEHGSLADGRYTLKAFAANINVDGVLLDGDNDGVAGGDYTFSNGLLRMFGDANGDAHVDIADFGQFSSSFNLNSSQTGFLAYFDWNNDGTIDIADFGQFSLRIFTTLP